MDGRWTEPLPSFAYHHIILWVGSSVCLLLRYDEEQNAEEHDWQRRSGDDGKEGETEWGFGDGFLKRADKKRQ